MNNGLIVGRAYYNRQPIGGLTVVLSVIEGTSELNTGRGVEGRPGNISLYTATGFPARGIPISTTTNNNGGFAIRFKWDFLGSGGIPNDTRPFYRAFAQRFSGGGYGEIRLEGETFTRRRGLIMNSPRTFADLSGVNIPVEAEGAVGMGTDIVSILTHAGLPGPVATTLPSPLIGRSVMETQMFFGIWVFEAN